MINTNQTNEVKLENEQMYDDMVERVVQTSLDDKIYEFVQDIQYTQNTIQPTTNPSFLFAAANATAITSSSQTSSWNLPPGVYNFSKMILNFQLSIGTSAGAPITAASNVVNSINAAYLPIIQNFEYYLNNGIRLFQISAVDKLSRLSGILNNKKAMTANRGFICNSQRNYLTNPSGALLPAGSLNATPDPYFYGATLATTGSLAAQTISDPMVQYIPYTQGLNNDDTLLGPLTAAGLTTTLDYSIPLCDLFPDSIFNVDKDIYISKISYIKITWNPVNQYGNSVTLDSTTLGYALGTNVAAAAQINNLELSVYTQTNQKICDAIIESQKNVSVPIVIPYVTMQSQVFNSGSNQNSSFKISTENTVTNLYKLYYGIFAPDTTLLTCNSSNINQFLFNSLMVKLNNTVVRSYVDLTKKEDIAHMMHMFPHGEYSSTRAIRYSGTYGMVLDNEPSCKTYTGSEVKGLEITPSNDLMVNYTTSISPTVVANTQLTHFCFAVTCRIFFFKGGEAYLISQI